MNGTVTIITVSIFAVISGIILISAIFSPVPRKIGFRNISRRIGNTILVVIGSLVGSALISGSLVLSDSLDKTFLNIVYEMMGEQDAEMTLKEKEFSGGIMTTVSEEEVDEIKEMLDIKEIDGVLPSITFTTSPQKLDKDGNPVINDYNVYVYAVNIDELNDFGVETPNLVDIEGNEILISDKLAKRLELSTGDTVGAQYGPVNFEFKVKKIYEQNGIIDLTRIIANQDYVSSQLGLPKGSSNTFTISAKGGVEPDNYDGKKFKETIEDAVDDFDSDTVDLTVLEWKEDALNGFGAKAMVIMFMGLSLFGVFAGILLIVNLYAMLAEERKQEMGILRAIALTRFQLTKTFIYEGFLYTIISSISGALAGLGIGYILVVGLDNVFQEMFSLTQDEGFFNMEFGFKVQSLVIAMCAGFLVTIVTTIISSYKVSKLNIVSAIRNLKEHVEEKISFKWIFKTALNAFVFIDSCLFLGTFFIVPEFFKRIREQGGDQNNFASMTQEKFDTTVGTFQGYILYLGIELILFFGLELVNNLVKTFFKKDIRRFTVSVAGILNILFTLSMVNFESFKTAFENESGGIGLFFISSVALVISFALVVAYNLKIISKVISWPLQKIGSLRSIVRMAFRYPAENTSRTGLTLVMYALIIFLIAFISIFKVTVNEQTRESIINSLGGYDVMIIPGKDMDGKQIKDMEDDMKSTGVVKDVSDISQTAITLPEYLYKDIPEAEYWGDPTEMPQHNDDDAFVTYYNGLPKDYIEKTNIPLSERADGYDTDEEVWNSVIEDKSKIVLGESYSATQGFGPHPKLEIGDKIKVADLFGNSEETKEVIGIIEVQESSTPGMGLYQHIITLKDYIPEDLGQDYIDSYSTRYLLVSFKSSNDRTEKVNKVKKAIIKYNIVILLNIDDLIRQSIGFIDSMIILLQGFLALSLIIGTSGLAIIITRAVHERQQQIGMLRSLGFKRWMILTSFYIESTFITVLGIIIGLSMGTLGAYITFTIAFKDTPDMRMIFPTGEIALTTLLVYVASMIFAALPSIKAAHLSPVEATNYQE